MTPELVAAYAAAERDLAEQFEAQGLDEPQQRAERHMRWLRRKGFRLHPELADGAPPRPVPASYESVKPKLDDARARVAEVQRAQQAAGGAS